MSEWITDRLPDPDDAFDDWVFVSEHGNIQMYLAVSVKLGMPWLPIVPPAPYVKPKRWAVQWHALTNCWHVIDTYAVMGYLHLDSSQAAAAQRICDIYNEVMP
jgi:hypothetical protein